MTVLCCVCKKEKKDGSWTRTATIEDENVSHGFCPDCYKKQHLFFMEALSRQIEADKEAQL